MKTKSGPIAFVSDLPAGYTFSFESNLYNHPQHIALLAKDKIISFYMIHTRQKKIIGLIYFSIVNNEAISLPNRPFGSFELAPTVNFERLTLFIQYIINSLSYLHVDTISIKSYSPLYQSEHFHLITFALISNGFEISTTDINHHIEVSDLEYTKLISTLEIKRLNRSRMLNFNFEKASVSEMESVYQFIRNCRLKKNQLVSIEFQHLIESVAIFPDHYIFFTVKDKGKIVAAAIAVKVNQHILYDFMYASDVDYNQSSPAVMLTEGIYNYCQTQHFTIIDLGTSSIQHQPQSSLITFKENIGGIPTVKFTFYKKLSK